MAALVCTLVTSLSALECKENEYVYGENDVVDALLLCSLTKSFDLDLTPYGDHIKSTTAALVEQGLSNKTSVLHARLTGLWTAKRPSFVQTGWRCNKNGTTTSTATIEVSGLSLEVIEKLDIPLHRNQHKLALHKPCKTFDLPLWMCRQTKPIYRTISTWVSKAYFNATLVQRPTESRPIVSQLSLIFTCPETFKQKITHSPSATYVLSKHLQHAPTAPAHVSPEPPTANRVKQQHNKRQVDLDSSSTSNEIGSTTTQSGNMPASAPYHKTIVLLENRATEFLRLNLNECIQSIDSDLHLIRVYNSFSSEKYLNDASKSTSSSEGRLGLANECSSKLWIKSRLELANEANELKGQQKQQVALIHSKRSRKPLNYPDDPSQLLNPFGFYHFSSNNGED